MKMNKKQYLENILKINNMYKLSLSDIESHISSYSWDLTSQEVEYHMENIQRLRADSLEGALETLQQAYNRGINAAEVFYGDDENKIHDFVVGKSHVTKTPEYQRLRNEFVRNDIIKQLKDQGVDVTDLEKNV